MVASVSFPKDDCFVILDEIVRDYCLSIIEEVVKEKRNYKPYQLFYDSIKSDLLEHCEKYMDSSGDPRLIKPLDLNLFTNDSIEAEKRKTTLIGLYTPEVDSKLYNILKKMRHNNGLLFCPCCGEDGAPGTLDHYLPKDIFPELSIFLANLTPMCQPCQGEKSTKFISKSGVRKFLHPYFDVMDECFFHVKIVPPFYAPSNFILSIVKGQPQILRVIISHIQGINFVERFTIYCETKHTHLLRIIEKKRKEQDPDSAESIIKLFLMQEEEKAKNSWGAIYYSSVLNTPELLEYLDNAELSKYL